MDFKFFRSNKVGGAALLLLILLISQSRVFDMLIETALGRTLLVALIIATSYMNKILGVVSVLLIIIAFSTSGIIEGMDHAPKASMAMDTKMTATDKPKAMDKTMTATDKPKAMDKPKASKAMDKPKAMDTTMATKAMDKPKATDMTAATDMPEATKAMEGFDLLGKEGTMRSKDSNKIPVQKTSNPVEGFAPFDDEFTSYTTF